MSIWSAIGGFFVNLFKGIFSASEAKTIESNLVNFVKTDVGALAVDAVEYVAASMPSADGVAKRDAAVAKLKVDAKTAGKDISSLATSMLNLFIEMALQAVLAKVAVV